MANFADSMKLEIPVDVALSVSYTKAPKINPWLYLLFFVLLVIFLYIIIQKIKS